MNPRESRPKQLDSKKAIGYDFPDNEYTLDERDAIIYALSLGFNEDPLNQDQLKYTYEGHENFTIYPTFCSMASRTLSINVIFSCPLMPMPENLLSLMVEQRFEIYDMKLKHGNTYLTKKKIVDVIDKDKFTLMGYKISTFDKQTGKLAFITYSRTALVGVKGDGCKGTGSIPSLPNRPKEQPDTHILAKISSNHSLLYRLNGYHNSIHVDPRAARKNNFKGPILHGIASLEICVKAVVQQLWGGDETLLKNYHSRFFGAIYPGETLQLAIWRRGNVEIFQGRTKERKHVSIYGIVERRATQKL